MKVTVPILRKNKNKKKKLSNICLPALKYKNVLNKHTRVYVYAKGMRTYKGTKEL
jgi:hypothetical protein